MNIEEIRTELLKMVAEGLSAPATKILAPEELDKLWKED